MLKGKFLVSLLHVMSWLPLSWARKLGACAGYLVWLGRGRTANVTLTNLAICLPELSEDERRRLARRSVVETSITAAESGAVWLWPVEKLKALIHVTRLEVLQKAHAKGKGVLIIAPHLGNWEVLGLYLSTSGLGESINLYQTPREPALDKLIYAARRRYGARLAATDNKGVAVMLKALRNGAIAGILPDQVPVASGGEFAPFFGRPALTMTLLSRLLAKTGCPAVLAYARREPSGFNIEFREVESDLYAEDLTLSLKALNAIIERAVREVPEQYHWEYKRFRKQPEGLEKPY